MKKKIGNSIRLKAIAHWVRNFHTLKNKYDLTLCQSRLHTASEIFIRHKKNSDRVRFFCIFRIRGKHFERCFDSLEPPYKRTPKSRMAIIKFIHFSQHKALYIDPCTLSSQKLGVFFLICGSSIASKASNWATSWSKLWSARDDPAAP